MRIGLWIDDSGLLPGAVAGRFRSAAEQGYARAWLSQRNGWDALTLIAAAAGVPDIDLGTAVVPTYPRHPLMLASQALTAQAAIGGRLALGVGPSHRPIIEDIFGYSFDRPARHTREYLGVLAPLLRGESVEFHGNSVSVHGAAVTETVEPAPELFLAALGPVMLEIAAELTAGTIVTWAGRRTVHDYYVPRIGGGEVIANVCLSVSDDPVAGRAWVKNAFGRAGDLPSYRAVLDREGVAGPEDTAIIGDEAEVERAVRQFADSGASELLVCPVGTPDEQERTMAVLGELGRRER
ncbi:MAG TPA: TIGR03564 family F420-dependent LLM class oxidoreductase [Mycobacteriales bacterium]|nr:TIGR03564 family F420-dependent LLM class oxidoreductase [Mycobacteriales bacterium]